VSPPLHELLEGLASSAPVGGSRSDGRTVAERAWAGGRRRRRRRRALQAATAGAAALVVLLALGPVLTGARADRPGPSSAGSSGQVVDGHPEHVGRQWWVRGLPDRPGPVAALLQAVEHRETHDEPDGWYAVSADGHRWRLPGDPDDDVVPALSPDGRLLGTLLGADGPYVVHDLVTGERTRFEDVGAQVDDTPVTRYRIALQHPSSWSPDGRWIAVQAEPDVLLLDVATGTARSLPRIGPLVGFAGSDRVAWLVDERPAPTAEGADGTPTEDAARLVLTDLSGRPVDDVRLRPTRGPLPFLGQWTGEVSSDGDVLTVADESQVRRFSATDGAELADPVAFPLASVCGAAFSATTGALVVPTTADDGSLVAQRVEGGTIRRQTVVDAGVGGRCLVWAGAALDAPGRRPRTLRSPVLLVAAVSGAALVGLLALRRRRF